MLEDIIAGEDPEHLASLALGYLRIKIPQLRLALEGKIRSHHCFLLRRLLDQIQFVEHEIALLDERLEDLGRSWRKRLLAGTRYRESIEWQRGPFSPRG
jgi:hypothetical protein